MVLLASCVQFNFEEFLITIYNDETSFWKYKCILLAYKIKAIHLFDGILNVLYRLKIKN